MKRFITIVLVLLAITYYACTKVGQSSDIKVAYEPCTDNYSQVVAKIGEKNITLGDIVGEDRIEYYEAQEKLFDFQQNKLKDHITKTVLKDAAGTEDEKKIEEFVEKTIVGNKISISKDDIKKFAKDRKIPDDRLNEELEGRIKDFLKSEKRTNFINEFVAKKTKDMKIVGSSCKPSRPRFEVVMGTTNPWGDEKAPVQIVEFSDFQCPYCARAAEDAIAGVKKAYGKSKVRIVFKHFPLEFHKDAPKASEASLCAGDQNKFWEYHDKLFADSSKIKPDDLKNHAKELKLDTTKFNECLDSGKKAAIIDEDKVYGSVGIKGASVKSTPTFFINGILVSGALPFEEFKKIIDEELEMKKGI